MKTMFCAAVWLFLVSLHGILPSSAMARRVTYAVAVGNNLPPSEQPELQKLRYADDDAVRYLELLERADARTALLAVLDDDTQRRHAAWARTAQAPSWQNLSRVLVQFGASMAADRQRGDQPVLFLTFSGHAFRLPDGRYALALSDGGLDRTRLFEEVLRPLADSDVHLIIDACHAAGLVGLKGPGVELEAERVELGHETMSQIVERGSLAQFPRVGALLATSEGQEAHEWSRLESGVFTHEMLSALSGASDVNGDLRIEYSEVEAFVAAANHSVDNPRARPRLVAHPPVADRRAVLFDLNALTPGTRLMRGSARGLSRFHVELRNGERYVDAHPSDESALAMVLPAGTGHFLRTDTMEAELPGNDDVDPSKLHFTPRATQARGSIDQALHSGLFATPFGLSYYRGFVDSRHMLGVSSEAVMPALASSGSLPPPTPDLSARPASAETTQALAAPPPALTPPVVPSARPTKKRSPGIRLLRWGGVALAAVGINLAAGSYSAYANREHTHESYTTMRAINDAGWITFGVGTVMHILSWVIQPASERTAVAPASAAPRANTSLEMERSR